MRLGDELSRMADSGIDVPAFMDDMRSYVLVRDVHRAKRAARLWRLLQWIFIAFATFGLGRFVVTLDWLSLGTAAVNVLVANMCRLDTNTYRDRCNRKATEFVTRRGTA